METYKASEPYQQLVVAIRSREYARATQIIEAQITASTGPERAFWLLVRMGKRSTGPFVPGNLALAWGDLEEALRAAPDDRHVQESALAGAMHVLLNTERPERLVPLVRLLGPRLASLKRTWVFAYNVGCLHMLTGQWGQAFRAMTRALEGFQALSPQAAAPIQGHLPNLYCWRAVCALTCNHAELAAADIEAADRLILTVAPASRSPVTLAMAKAELALAGGRLGDGRAVLQGGIAESGLNLHVSSSPILIKVDLLAARIARADSNPAGFRHFADKALARAEHHNLPLSAAMVHRVMAGADR